MCVYIFLGIVLHHVGAEITVNDYVKNMPINQINSSSLLFGNSCNNTACNITSQIQEGVPTIIDCGEKERVIDTELLGLDVNYNGSCISGEFI